MNDKMRCPKHGTVGLNFRQAASLRWWSRPWCLPARCDGLHERLTFSSFSRKSLSEQPGAASGLRSRRVALAAWMGISMALPRAIRTLLGAVRVVKGFPWWLLSPPTQQTNARTLDFGNRTFFALAPALGANCSCVHALRCARTCMNLRSIRAVLLLCTFTGWFSNHKAFLQNACPLSSESPTFHSCTPGHSACAVPNGTARSFCLSDGR